MVTVHHFRVWDFANDRWVYPPLKSSAERIKNEARGEIIPDTAEEVDLSDLDEHGRYDPKKSEAKNTDRT
jgi:hypothetical protein